MEETSERKEEEGEKNQPESGLKSEQSIGESQSPGVPSSCCIAFS